MQDSTELTVLELIRWNGVVVSPYDSTSKVYQCARNRYKCRNTNRYFNVLTKTIFQNTRLSLSTWFNAIQLYTENPNISSVHLAQELNLSQKTAWQIIKKMKRHISVELQTINVLTDQDTLPLSNWFKILGKK